MACRIEQYNLELPCCYSFLKRSKIVLKKEMWNKIRKYDGENHIFLFPSNDRILIDSILNIENLKIKVPKTLSLDSQSNNTKDVLDSSLSKIKNLEDMYLLLYNDVIIAKGLSQSLIYDLSEKRLFGVPNSFVDAVNMLQGNIIGNIIDSFSQSEKSIIISYIDFLVSNNLAHLVSDIRQFGTRTQYMKGFKERLNLSTSILESAIIDIDRMSSFDIKSLLKRLTNLKCRKVLMRFWECNMSFFTKALSCIRESNSISYLDLYIPNEMFLQIRSLLVQEPKVFNILAYQCSESSVSVIKEDVAELRKVIYKCIKESLAPSDCGNIYFGNTALIPNRDYVLRNMFVNSCLYKKISVDSEGLVKNCPSMKNNFGYVDSVDLLKIIENSEFRKYWYISKDEISTCHTCQYRYSCFDCRAYTNDGTLYGCPSKCHFSLLSNYWKK